MDVEELQLALAELMSRYDVPGLQLPTVMPKVLPADVEASLHSGPFCPWRPTVKAFGTVSQRILLSDARTRCCHYFYRSTNEPPEAEGPSIKHL